MTSYAKIIEKGKVLVEASPPRVDHLSLEDLHDFVGIISDTLKEPGVGALDRIVLNEERKIYRAEIARRIA